jgi:D-tyrosyl-tRNA(Tyr) deacylase
VRAVLQRVSRAEARAGGEVLGRVGRGLVVLVAVEKGDSDADAEVLARKVAGLRVFPGKTPSDLDVRQASGACLVVSQFTLAAELRKGNRPSWSGAEEPARAEALVARFASALGGAGVPVETGRFRAEMEVELVNDGPVTLLVGARGGAVRDLVVEGASPPPA